MKRYVFLPARTVTVEDGTVRDLDGNELGFLRRGIGATWLFGHPDQVFPDHIGNRPTQAAALAALLADPSCPTPGPNRYDR